MFAGPSITWANHRYLSKAYGVTLTQSLASGDLIFNVHGGTNSRTQRALAVSVDYHW
jgi:outer membrane scaffolding protein for murein synthesis (MipA/OmpV family)